MADCAEVVRLLGAFRDGELESEQVELVARHLAHCAQCERTLGEICRLGEELRAAVGEPCLEGFVERVMSRIEHTYVPLRLRLWRRIASFDWRLPVAVTSASLAAALASVAAFMVLTRPAVDLRFASSSTFVRGEDIAEQPRAFQLPQAGEIGSRGQVVISRLETSLRHVAVWSEPEANTTVIWLPEDAETDD